MTTQSEDRPGLGVKVGSRHYRAFVGPPRNYDLVSASQFNLLTFLGLREDHFILDIGCGSLRAGRLFIAYLLPEHYFGIEPEQWLIEEGIANEIGNDLIRIKSPVFSNDRNFTLTEFNRQFDYLIAQSIFSHASQGQIRRCLEEAKKVMKPSSIFVATFLKGEENYTGDEWVYPSCVPYTLDRIVELTQEQGLVCKPLTWNHPGNLTWIAIVHPNHEEVIDLATDPLPYLKSELDRYKQKLSKKESELDRYKKRLANLQRHSYVRLPRRMNMLIQRIKRLSNNK